MVDVRASPTRIYSVQSSMYLGFSGRTEHLFSTQEQWYRQMLWSRITVVWSSTPFTIYYGLRISIFQTSWEVIIKLMIWKATPPQIYSRCVRACAASHTSRGSSFQPNASRHSEILASGF
jgi:hypothetical protein